MTETDLKLDLAYLICSENELTLTAEQLVEAIDATVPDQWERLARLYQNAVQAEMEAEAEKLAT